MRTDKQRAFHAAYMRKWRAKKAREAWDEWDLRDPTWFQTFLVTLAVLVTAAVAVGVGAVK